MKDMLKKSLAFGLGLAVTSKEQIEKTVDELVKKGEIAPEESRRVINQMLERGEEERVKLMNLIKEQVEHVQKDMNLVSKDELKTLNQRLTDLEARVEMLEQKKEEQGNE